MYTEASVGSKVENDDDDDDDDEEEEDVEKDSPADAYAVSWISLDLDSDAALPISLSFPRVVVSSAHWILLTHFCFFLLVPPAVISPCIAPPSKIPALPCAVCGGEGVGESCDDSPPTCLDVEVYEEDDEDEDDEDAGDVGAGRSVAASPPLDLDHGRADPGESIRK